MKVYVEIGQRYWMRRGSKAEQEFIRLSHEEYCGFCGKPTLPSRLTWNRLLIEIVPFNHPQTLCCLVLEEPPPGSFAIRILSGCKRLNNIERWCSPAWATLLTPCEAVMEGAQCQAGITLSSSLMLGGGCPQASGIR
jgi:hypothetical protein